jgi:hypothetical protein
MCPAMDSSTWDTKNLEIWSETASLLLTLGLHSEALTQQTKRVKIKIFLKLKVDYNF